MVIWLNEECKEEAQEHARAEKVAKIVEKVAIGMCILVSLFALTILVVI